MAETSLSLEETVKLISNYTGKNDVQQFKNACDLTTRPIDEKYGLLLIKYVVIIVKIIYNEDNKTYSNLVEEFSFKLLNKSKTETKKGSKH